jgi:hypothetical protein
MIRKKLVLKNRPTTSTIKEEKGQYITGPIAQHTIHPLRMQLFLPKKSSDIEDYPKPKATLIRETDKGKIEFFTGSLNATHCDIVEILLTKYEKYRTFGSHNEKNKLCRTCKFTAHQLTKDLNVGNVSRDWVIKRLMEMKTAVFVLTPSNPTEKWRFMAISIIDSVLSTYSEKETCDYEILVRFSPEFLALREYDVSVHLEKAHKKIMSFDEAWIRMFIRYVLSQEVCNERLSSVFYHIGIATHTTCRRLDKPQIKLSDPAVYSRYKKAILVPEMQKRLTELGIIFKPAKDESIKEPIVHYHKTELRLVRTEAPKVETTKQPQPSGSSIFDCDDDLADLYQFD